MDWFVKAFIKSSLAWFGAGVSLGVAMAVHPTWAIYRTAHIHMNVLGFVTMMIFGVAYHVIPRFTGHPLHSRRLATAQWWMANVGLAVFVAALILRLHMNAQWLMGLGGILSAAAAFAFIYNMWRTIDGTGMRQQATQAVASAANTTPLRRAIAK
ncbi:MAG TPA: cbb3-type cytochrome c oxidase subunit I [Gemmatimonadaceae bacterium]|jgi:cytochrome c oxidase cbb3-type subunit 1|nr:cbb3-type cytochrome c oxidase subunit I [Gemmatimonadaceae bacterium]